MSIEKQTIFKGVCTALITPFHKGEIDYESLQSLIEMQIFKLHTRPTTTTTKSLQSCPTLCDPRPTESKFWVWGLAACVLTRLPRETDAR